MRTEERPVSPKKGLDTVPQGRYYDSRSPFFGMGADEESPVRNPKSVAPPLVGDGPRITPRVYNPDTHLKHRCRAATLAIPFVAALAVAFATRPTLGFPLPAGAGPDGAAPPWGASMAVGPYAEVDLRTG
ncbi:MAG: hypothetical protein ACE5F9_15345, partial [Phycisphaerae bacterium]